MTIFLLSLIGFAFLAMLYMSLKDGTFSPLFLFMAFSTIGIWVRAFQLTSEAGPGLVLAPWVLGSELSTSALTSLVELFIALCIIFPTAYLVRLNTERMVGNTKVPNLLRARVLTRRQSLFLVFVGIGSVALFLTIMSNFLGGLFEVISALQSRSVAVLSGRGYVGLLVDLPIVVNLLLAFSYFRRKELNVRYKGKWAFYGTLILSLVILIVMGGRGAILQYLLMLGIVYHACKKQRVKISWALIFLILLSFIVIVVGLASRYSAQTQKPLIESISASSENLVATLSAPFALLDHYMLAKIYVDSKGYDYGEQYASFLVRPIPRSIWPNKPLPTGLKLRQVFWGDTTGGITPTVFGELYISFGYFGLFFGSVLFGVALGFLGRLFNTSLVDSSQSVFYALMTVVVVFSVVRSGLGISFPKILIYMFVVIFLNLLFKLRLGGFTKGARPQC